MITPATRPGLWRRTPPAIFPPILGAFGLGHAWRTGGEVLGFGSGIGDLLLGAVSAVYLLAITAWLSKLVRRPSVLLEEVRVLPGRSGASAAMGSCILFGAAVLPYQPGVALWLGAAGAIGMTFFALLYTVQLLTGPREARVVTPVWHLVFVASILGPLVWVPLGLTELARWTLFITIAFGAAILAISARQLIRALPTAPMRPLLAIHIAPFALYSVVCSLLGYQLWAAIFGALALAVVVVLLPLARWLTVAGFSALWGAFTFPVAGFANAMVLLADGGAVWRWLSVAGLLLASGVVVPIAVLILRDWARGGLAAKTNAATA